MKIRVKNLGMIRDTEVDLRPLTIIIGPNNTSKTYLAYSIYGMWIEARIGSSFSLHSLRSIRHTCEIDDHGANFTIDKPSARKLSRAVNGYVEEFRNSLDRFFQDTSGKLFQNTAFSIDLVQHLLEHPIIHVTRPEGISIEGWRKIDIERVWAWAVTGRVSNYWFPKPLLLPAERNAFILTYKMLTTRRYRLLRDRGRLTPFFDDKPSPTEQRQLDLLREQGDIRYPQPIEDFLDFLSDIELGPEPDLQDPDRKAFGLLADKIETHLHGGQTLRFQSTRLSGKELKLDIHKDLAIDLYNASSSIKQIAPLLLYLRFRAKPGDFLIIDEPEMNLHPETQAKLLEALAMIVNAGVRILLTTHSPYFMDHLNNIVAGDLTKPSILKKQAKHLYMQDTQGFLSMDQVSAYVMEGDGLRSLKDPDFGIRWDTLSDVSGDIQQRYFAIRKAEQGSRAKTKAKA